MCQPRVPDRINLGAVVVVLLKVDPASTTVLLVQILPVLVAVAD